MRIFWLAICLLLSLGTAGQGLAAEVTAPVYLNGERSGMVALVENNIIYLPLREVAEIFAVDVDWNQEEKRVDYGIGNSRMIFWLERVTVASAYLNDAGELSWDNEWEPWYAPLARGGKVWLAVSQFENMSEGHIYWDEDKGVVDISGIPVWRDGEWTIYGPGAANGILWDENGNGWVSLRLGEPTMGHDNLWRLTRDGARERVARDWSMQELKVYGGKCYWLSAYMGFAGGYDIMAVDAEGNLARYGSEDMIYNNSIVAYGAIYVPGGRESAPVSWRVDDKGVWATGFAKAALSDDVVSDEELARETYGLYRLTVGGQEMVEKYELPRKPTPEEQFGQGMSVWVPLEVNGEESGEGGMWSSRFGPEPFLAVRDMCRLLGCELIWRQETDQLEIVAEGQRLIIDCDLSNAERIYDLGYEVRAVRIETGADGRESRKEFKVLLSKYGEMRTLPWSFYQGLNGAKLEWDREENVIRLTK